MVELRKRKTPPPAPVRPAKKKAAPKADKSKVANAKAAVTEKIEAVKDAVTGGANGEKTEAPTEAPEAAGGAPKVGATIDISGFGGEVETNEGVKTTLAKLLEQSKSGVILFTYPKASTPGCTRQVCFFRDSYEPLTATGFDIYGLSGDSPKANTTFRKKHDLPYPLLCDPSRTLISAIGLKNGKSTARGVFMVDKSGKVLAAETGTPEGTMIVAKKIIEEKEGAPASEAANEKVETEQAKTASEVADTAAKLDADKA